MTGSGRILALTRRVPLTVALAITAYLFALLAPIIPAQLFLRCGGFSGFNFGCPLIRNHDAPTPGGFTRSYLYSITYQLTHFGSSYNIDEGYSLPSGLYMPGLGNTTASFTLSIIVLPLVLAAIICIALYIRSEHARSERSFNAI